MMRCWNRLQLSGLLPVHFLRRKTAPFDLRQRPCPSSYPRENNVHHRETTCFQVTKRNYLLTFCLFNSIRRHGGFASNWSRIDPKNAAICIETRSTDKTSFFRRGLIFKIRKKSEPHSCIIWDFPYVVHEVQYLKFGRILNNNFCHISHYVYKSSEYTIRYHNFIKTGSK